MIVFMLDSMAKKHDNNNKRINIILVISRLTLLTNNKRYRQISYLNGFQQIFIENLSKDALQVDELPVQGAQFLQKHPKLFNFDEIVSRLFGIVVKRFDFTTRYDQQPGIINDFLELLVSMSESEAFKKMSTEYIIGRFRQNHPKNWKKEVLLNKEVANLAATTEIAMRLCL
jgi:hypothetical protein